MMHERGEQRGLRIGEVARLAHVTVRALHHYDRIGLLRPSGRSEAGYRLYAESDLERLQTVLLYRELGFELGEIRDLLAEPGFDRREALRAQRAQLARRSERLGAMLALIDTTLAAMDEGIPMGHDDMFEVFGDFDPAEHEAEAEARWGETEAFKESARRTRRYTKDDWRRFNAESEALTLSVAALLDEGVAPDDPRATDAAERHRLLIDTWFYPCPPDLHEQLGRMYVTDPRFTATYEKIRPGLAQYLSDAIAANAARSRA
jgi:MerR family transcriptional regulator, thiopeptide resistance regulator